MREIEELRFWTPPPLPLSLYFLALFTLLLEIPEKQYFTRSSSTTATLPFTYPYILTLLHKIVRKFKA